MGAVTEQSPPKPNGWPLPTWGRLAAFGLLTRVAVVVLGCVLGRLGLPAGWEPEPQTVAEGEHDFDAELAEGGRRWIEPWYHFDALWYAHVSERGYGFRPGRQSSSAFLPLLPLVMAGGAAVGLDRFWVGLAVVNLAFVAGLACFGRAVLRVTGEPATAWKACLLLTAYPWSFFFSAPYQESLALALTAAALLAWLCWRPALAGFGLAVASAARVTALALSAGVVCQWAWDLACGRPARHAAWFVALVGAAGFGGFVLYLYLTVGEPRAYFRAQEGWGRQPAGIENVFRALVPGAGGVKNYVVMLVFLALGVRAWARRGPLWGCLVLVPVLMVMASGSRMSMTRLSLASFPAFLDAAELLRGRVLFWAGVAVGSALQVYFLYLYVNRVFVA
jgi:hypothetical protein